MSAESVQDKHIPHRGIVKSGGGRMSPTAGESTMAASTVGGQIGMVNPEIGPRGHAMTSPHKPVTSETLIVWGFKSLPPVLTSSFTQRVRTR
jgi:hypothetical protein